MNSKLQEAMANATRLTRAGQLHEATAALQQALMGRVDASPAHPGAADDGITIDVEARFLDEQADAVPHPAPSGTGFDAGYHEHPFGGRHFKLFRPAQRTADARAPALVVMLHGCTQEPDDFARGTAMNDHAGARGWWVLYPAQATAANASGCWNWFQPAHQQRDQGEPAILSSLVSRCVERHGLDPARVFVAGLSAGGAMAVTLGATHPEQFAAVGAHSALPHASAHDLPSALAAMRQGAQGRAVPRRVPTIVFHGDQDHTVHPRNAQAVLQQARALPANLVADDEAVETELAGVPGGHRYTRRLHRDGQGQVHAEYWLVHGAGHAWSGGQAQGSFTDPRGPDASAQMLRFFDAQRPA